LSLSSNPPPPLRASEGVLPPLTPSEYATGWKGGREGREGVGVVGRPHFEGTSLRFQAF